MFELCTASQYETIFLLNEVLRLDSKMYAKLSMGHPKRNRQIIAPYLKLENQCIQYNKKIICIVFGERVGDCAVNVHPFFLPKTPMRQKVDALKHFGSNFFRDKSNRLLMTYIPSIYKENSLMAAMLGMTKLVEIPNFFLYKDEVISANLYTVTEQEFYNKE